MYSSFQSYTPSKRLSSILSQYLEFDENQLHLGLWSGDLQLQNVKIKKEALGPIFNSWKNSNKSAAHRDFFYLESISWEDAVNVILVQGTVGSLRVRVPWQKLLIGKSDAVVHVTLSNVTIVVRVEPDPSSSSAYSIPTTSNADSTFQDILRSIILASMLDDASSSTTPFTRADKQQMIVGAELNHSKHRDIPRFDRVVPHDSIFNHFFRDTGDDKDLDETIRDERIEVESEKPTPPPPTTTWIERMTRSLASSLGWRMAKALQATVRNLSIVLVQEDMEVGITNQLLEIKEGSSLHEPNNEDGNSHPSSVVEGIETPILSKPDTAPTSTYDSDGLSTKTTHASRWESADTRKTIRIVGLGVFIRKIRSLTKTRREEKIPIDDYVLRPTSVTIQCGFSNQSAPSTHSPTETVSSSGNPHYATDTHDVQSVSSERVRRGKRDKRRKVSLDITSDTRNIEEGFGSFLHAEVESVATRERIDSSTSHDELSANLSPQIDEKSLSKSVSVDINIPSIHVICSTQHYQLGHSMLCSLARTKNGRPLHNPCAAMGEKGLQSKTSSTLSPSKRVHPFYRSTLRAWWKYAILNVLRDVHRGKILENIQKRCSNISLDKSSLLHSSIIRKEYIALFLRLRLKSPFVNDVNMEQDMLETMLLLLEDILQVEQILLFRSMARKIASDEHSVFKKIVFGSADISPTISYIPLPFSLREMAKVCLYPSVPSRTHSDEAVRLKRPAYTPTAETMDPHYFRLCVSCSLHEASFILLSSTGAVSTDSDVHCETDSNDDISVLTMGSFEVSSCINDASEFRSPQQVRSDGRMFLFGQKHHVLLSTTIGLSKAELSSYPDHIYSLTIQSLTCCSGDAEILSFKPLNSRYESNASVGRKTPGFFDCKIARIAKRSVCEAPIISAALARVVLNLDVTWLLKVAQFFGNKGSSTFPCPVIRLPSLELSNIYEAQKNCMRGRMRKMKPLVDTISWQGLDLNIVSLLHEKDIGNSGHTNTPNTRLTWHLSFRHLAISSGRKTALHETHFLLHRFSSDIKLRVEQLLHDLCNNYETHTCVKITGLDQSFLYTNISKTDVLHPLIEPLDLVFLFSSAPRIPRTDIPKESCSVVMSSIDLKICHRRIQAVDSLFKCFVDNFSSLIRVAPDDGSAIDQKRFSVPNVSRSMQLLVSKMKVQIENDMKGAPCIDDDLKFENSVQQLLLEYLSHLTCFHQAATVTESTDLAKTMCAERISSMGLPLGDAFTLTAIAKEFFLEELELIEKSWSSQKKILIQLVTESSYFSLDSPREHFTDTSETDIYPFQSRQGHRPRSQSDSNLSSFGLSPKGESTESRNDYEHNFVILEETIALSVRRAMRSREFMHKPVRASLDITCSEGLFISKDNYGCFHRYHCAVSVLSILSNASSIVQILNMKLSLNEGTSAHKMKMTAAVDALNVSFSSLFAVDVIETLSPLEDYLSHRGCESRSSAALTVDMIQIHISHLTLLLFTGDPLPQPFMKCSFSGLDVDVLRDSTFSSPKHVVDVRASSNQFICKDLSPEGLLYPDVIESNNQALSFDFRLNISSDPSVLPSEVIISFSELRLFVCRRFISEIVQYCMSPDYGIGHLLRIYTSPSTELKPLPPSQPMKFELHLANSSLLLPKQSKSFDGLVALKARSISIFKSLHLESWTVPRVYSFDQANVMTKEASVDSKDGTINRVNVIISDLEVFVGNENPRSSFTAKFNSSYPLNIRRDIQHEALIFEDTVLEKSSTSEMPLPMLTRRWQKVTMNPFELKLMIDYAPHLRLCVMDTSESEHDVCFEMRMSQLYALLSLWYSNMQELPRMFPFTNECIQSGATYPETPDNWPEYDSEQFVQRLKLTKAVPKMEIALSFKKIDLNCSFESPSYFHERLRCEHMLDGDRQGILLQALDLVVFILNDEDGLMRVSCGATNFSLIDLREGKSEFTKNFGFRVNGNGSYNQMIDASWGVSLSEEPLPEYHYLPFCASVFMTPDRWCQINLGLDNLDVSTSDLAPVWMALEYFGNYFRNESYGHPHFMFDDIRKRTIKSSYGSRHIYDDQVGEEKCLNMDFRLCALRPHFAIPTDRQNLNEPFLVLESDGLFYRYRGVGYFFSSQDLYCKLLDVTILRDYYSPSMNRAMRDFSGSDSGIRNLVDGTNFVMEYSYHSKTKHTDVRISVPSDLATTDKNRNWRELDLAKPVVLAPSYICRSVVFPVRQVQNRFCNIHVSVESLNVALSLLIDFIGPYDQSSAISSAKTVYESYVFCLRVVGVRLLVSDDELGMHLPFYSVSIPSMTCTVSRIPNTSAADANRSQYGTDLQILADIQLWIDYFKLSPTRSFEPFIEPYSCILSIEKSLRRGRGFKLRSECPFHVNVTSASLESLDAAIKNFRRSWKCLFDTNSVSKKADRIGAIRRNGSSLITVPVRSYCAENTGRDIEIMHLLDSPGLDGNISPFLFINYCGFRVRFCQRTSAPKLLVHYLAHGDSAPLQMPATRSIVRNLKVTEVSCSESSQRKSKVVETRHALDLQIPGFMWMQLPIDAIGMRFVDLTPKSSAVQSKIQDWRFKNLLKLLTDIRIVDGGRHISVFSPIEIVNRTGHKIEIATHVDPTQIPPSIRDSTHRETTDYKAKFHDFMYEAIGPDQTYYVPLFLLESALHLKGTNLGSLWIRPNVDDSTVQLLLRGSCTDSANGYRHIGFCSNPLHLNRLVLESSMLLSQARYIYEEGDGSSLNTGLDLSCPITTERWGSTSRFCYCMEIRRKVDEKSIDGPHTLKTKYALDDLRVVPEIFRKKRKNETDISTTDREDSHSMHGPVAYSLVLYPPLIIENLLPERGRFELMHATRRQVLWFGDLSPGESVPIHTVGLDAPLLLLMNLGYCRTPFGQGILVHHGGNPSSFMSHRPPIGTSGDKKGYQTTYTDFGLESNAAGHSDPYDEEDESLAYSEDDLASETIVVDSLGQKLTLMVNNELGNGGQRHIAVWCPFWILNSTEHALLYKQERASTFVSGTVHSNSLDGSRQVDGSLRVRGGKDGELDTVFPGRPGVLASSSGSCTLTPEEIVGLLDEHLPLLKVSAAAFMFNFQEKLALGQQRLCVQLKDTSGKTRYTSDWSSGFSLDSVGVTQTIGMHCADGRLLEVAVKISIPPGALGKYTKIVRFSPRYMVVNHLPYPIRIWQDSSLVHPARQSERYKNEDESPSSWHVDRHGNIDGVVYQYEPLFGGSIALDFRAGTKEMMKGRTSAHRSALYIVSLGSKDVVPFHLPDTRQDREIRVDVGSRFNLTSSFPVDVIGADYVLRVTEVEDIRLFDHVDTRAAPLYTVQLPPADDLEPWDGDLGLWLESIQWDGEGKIVVKGIKRGKYSYNSTDVRVGDELLYVNDVPVTDRSFSDVMKLIKDNLDETYEAYKTRNTEPLSKVAMRPKFLRRFDNVQMSTRININIACVTFTFNTLEHRIDDLRQRGLRSRFPRGRRKGLRSSGNTPLETTGSKSRKRAILSRVDREEKIQGNTFISATIKLLNQSICVFVQPFVGTSPPYRIDNRSINFTVHYRQYRCEEHDWSCLAPGESSIYCWDEPSKDLKLSVRIGDPIVSSNETKRPSQRIWRTLKSEEHGAFGPICVIKLDEIGFEEFLQSPSKQAKSGLATYNLYCRVDTDGSTRVLIISEVKALEDSEELTQIERHLSTLSSRIDDDNTKLLQLKYLNSLAVNGSIVSYLSHLDNIPNPSLIQSLPSPETALDGKNSENIDSLSNDALMQLEQELKRLIEFPEDTYISRTHQLSVEVLEAKGLPAWDSNQLLSPYAVVKFNYYIPKGERSLRSLGRARRSIKRPTYYVKKTLTPKWSGQTFVFDVPSKAVESTHGYSIVVKIKNYSDLGNHTTIGYSEIHLSSLKSEKELFGWHPLMSKASKGTDFLTLSDGAVRGGSILLRLHWVHSVPALLDYYMLSVERRIAELENYREGMKHHAGKVREALKKKPRFIDLHSLTELPPNIMQKSAGRREMMSPKGFEDIQRNWATNLSHSMRSARLHHIWSRSMQNTAEKGKIIFGSNLNDIDSLENNNLRLAASTDADLASSNQQDGLETSVSLSPYSLDKYADTPFLQGSYGSYQKTGRPRARTSANTDYSIDNGGRSTSAKIGSWFHRGHLNNINSSSFLLSISDIQSWVAAMIFFNEPLLAPNLLPEKARASESTKTKCVHLNQPYPWLTLPVRAVSQWHNLNNDFLHLLYRSRESFGETAQKTLMTMLNPGGVLKLRPIMAHNVPDSFTGMYVKVKYGDETKRTQTVNAKATPKWTDDYLDSPSTDHSQDVDEAFERTENDLEVHVPPFKTIGSLRLSLVGVRANTKVEIGVVHIPLSNAIEATYDHSHRTKSTNGMYVRWFPLKNPKDCIPLEGDLGLSANSEPERTDPNLFLHFYTPTLKIALWWEPLVLSDDVIHEDIGNNEIGAPSEQLAETYVHLSLNCVSLAMIDSMKAKELASFCANNLDLRFSSTKASSRLNVTIGWIQLDNPDENAVVPVILSPTATKNPQPTLFLLAFRDNLRSKMIHSFKLMALDVEELDMRIEEGWMFSVWDFFLNLLKHKKIAHSLKTNCEERKVTDYVPTPNEFLQDNSESDVHTLNAFLKRPENNNGIATMKKVYVEKLILGALKVNVSYMKSASPDDRKRNGSQYDKSPDTYRTLHVAHTLPNIILSIIPSITNAPIAVGGKVIDNVFEYWGEIFISLQNYYMKEVLHQVYKVVGSLDFVGNPTMVLNSFMKGARDFVVQPLREFLRSPDRLGIGVAKGTLSLVSHFFAGVFGFLTNISIAGGNAAATFSLDERFQRWHKKQLEDHARHVHSQYRPSGLALVASAITLPLQDILLGVAFATTGIFVEPYNGARLRGKVGFLSGVAVGALGIVTKPLVGIFDAFAHASETVHDVARLLNVEEKKLTVRVRRLRLPYIFGLCNILLPYDPVDCRSTSLLHLFDISRGKGEYEQMLREPTNEVLVVSEVLHMAPGLDIYVIVTTLRIVVVRVKTDNAQPQVIWRIDFQSEIEIISSLENRGHNGIVLRIASHKPMSLIERNDSLFSIQEELSEIDVSDIDGIETDQAVFQIKPSEASSHRKGENKSFQKSYKLVGDFLQRAQLTRIHNSICCLSQNYSSVIHDVGINSDDTGYVYFKNMMFDGSYEANQNEGIITVDLDQVIWLDQERDRYKWTLADEEELSRRQGGPEWLIKARARNIFTPMLIAPTSIPPNLNLEDPAVINITKKLKRGRISVAQANAELLSLSIAVNTKISMLLDETSPSIVTSPISSAAADHLAIVPYHENQIVPIEDTQTEVPGTTVVAYLKRKMKL